MKSPDKPEMIYATPDVAAQYEKAAQIIIEKLNDGRMDQNQLAATLLVFFRKAYEYGYTDAVNYITARLENQLDEFPMPDMSNVTKH